jgi:spore germination cell wall hydrolase CwlJ-like protein
VRIRLLFTLALFLSTGATPLHASLGPAPQCLPLASQGVETDAAKSHLTAGVIPNYDAEDRDYMIRTIVFEATGEPDEGKIAVAYVILNRVKSGGWGACIKDVVVSPWQFEPWMTKRDEMEKLSPGDPRYRDAAQIADSVLTGQMPDPTAGAMYFLNPTMVRERRGGSLPSWAQGEGQEIGHHTFYRPDEGVMLERAALSTGPLATFLSCTRLEAGEAPHVG